MPLMVLVVFASVQVVPCDWHVGSLDCWQVVFQCVPVTTVLTLCAGSAGGMSAEQV